MISMILWVLISYFAAKRFTVRTLPGSSTYRKLTLTPSSWKLRTFQYWHLIAWCCCLFVIYCTVLFEYLDWDNSATISTFHFFQGHISYELGSDLVTNTTTVHSNLVKPHANFMVCRDCLKTSHVAQSLKFDRKMLPLVHSSASQQFHHVLFAATQPPCW